MNRRSQDAWRELRTKPGHGRRHTHTARRAGRAGVTRQTINAIEGGKDSPTLEVAFAIAAALGVALDQVFEYEAPVSRVRR